MGPTTLAKSDRRPRVNSRVMDQCMTGQTGPNGIPVHKRTGIVASSQTLLKPLERFVCDGKHQHDTPSGSASKQMQVWPWRMAAAIADGIGDLLREKHKRYTKHAYPTGETQTKERDTNEPDKEADKWKCQMCRWRYRRDDPRHTRIEGECKWPHTAPRQRPT